MINPFQADSASFRDPRGHVYHKDGKVFRTVLADAVEDFEFVNQSKCYETLIAEGKLLGMEITYLPDIDRIEANASYILQHPKLAFISYPYEWTFSALKAAALLQLEIHLRALDFGVTLLDSSAYNIQFMGSQPIFIDHLAFTKYHEGMIWSGYRQFCEQFLVPLLLQAYCKVSPHAWYRGNLEGIGLSDLNKILPWYYKLLPKVFFHVVLHASLQKTTPKEAVTALPKVKLTLSSLRHLLASLHTWINKLTLPRCIQTHWQHYKAEQTGELKTAFIKDFVTQLKPELMYDLGCNNGQYAELALDAGAQTIIGFDTDQGVLEQAYSFSRQEKRQFLPLYMNLANPSPEQGWMQEERKGLNQRGPAAALIALAFVHHLVFTRNIPLRKVVPWLINLASEGVIEFVPKSDPMVQNMLLMRRDIFIDYSLAMFLKILQQYAEVVRIAQISEAGRVLVWYRVYKK